MFKGFLIYQLSFILIACCPFLLKRHHFQTVYCAAHKFQGSICDDFTVRRRVVIEKDVQQLLTNEGFKKPGDKIRIGPMIFHHPGHILNNTSNFHTRDIIYPFDYSATRIFWSPDTLGKRCSYHCSIDVKNEAPLFKMSYQKHGKTVELENSCVDALWKEVLDSIALLRSKTPDILSIHVVFHTGTFLHGLTERNLLRIIEGLPGSDKLEGYTFCYGRIETVTLEHLVPFNPSQSARTEKYTKHTKRFACVSIFIKFSYFLTFLFDLCTNVGLYVTRARGLPVILRPNF